uniref:SET domain-containing protein n=1 Tax=Phytophthora ramorum TaxID=164328 RepID=H3HB97_PHYRM
MPSPPSSVIFLDDSSDEDTAASGRRSAPLLVSSSDESDVGGPSQAKKPRVESSKISFAAEPTARKGLSYGSGSEEERGEPSDDEIDTSEQSLPRVTKKKVATTKSSVGHDGRMYSDAMSFSELQAQQREFERLRAKAHRVPKAAPHNAARRTSTAGAKRKASDAVAASHSSPHSRNKSSVMKKTTSPSPFDFDFPGSSDDSSSSSSSPDENRAVVLGSARAKQMSLKDVVAQEPKSKRKGKNNSRSSSAKSAAQPPPPVQIQIVSDTLDHRRNATDTVMHATVWRNVFFDTAPPNLLPLDSEIASPFNSEFDRPLLTYGVRANVRVEDDPIMRYKPYFGEDDDGADIDVAWYDAVGSKDPNLSSGLDGEVNEFLLRLIVRECGTSDKVFNALKKVPGFAQAYSDYSEIKKLDDSMRLAARRLKEANELISNKPAAFPLAKVATLEPALSNREDFQKTLEERCSADENAKREDSHSHSGDIHTDEDVGMEDGSSEMCYETVTDEELYPQVPDESEHLDDSHYEQVTAIVKKSLQADLRAIIGDNPCIISSMVKSTTCKEVGAFLESERQSICCNVNILRGLHKKIGVAYSTTHGWGAFATEPIKRGEFIYEYHGALLSQDEAERRGSIYDKMTISFLFDVDDDSVVDAIRKGNKSKFANHSAVYQKCKGKVLTVGGGEELFFDYGYHGETAPDWSQLRIKGSVRHGPKKKSEEGDKKEDHQG